jgi:5-methylcytosine-specific restriction protein A
MPSRPPKPCGKPGCRNLTHGRFCEAHAGEASTEAWRTTEGSAHSRGYGATWRKLRAFILARDPICVKCGRRPSKTVDHIVPKKRGGTNEPSNLQGLCTGCNGIKTAHDGNQGRTLKRDRTRSRA